MEFWGVEVKKGEPLKVVPGEGNCVHLSQACLGETKNENKESVCLFVEVDNKKLVLSTLSTEKLPQQQFDLVFDKDFELTHNWKNGSVYFYGYKAQLPGYEVVHGDDSDESEDELVLPTVANNGKAVEKKPVQAENSNAGNKKESGSGKQKVQIVEPIKDEDSEDDDDESDDDDMSGDEDDSEAEGDEDDDESDDSDSDEETPKKAVPSKKRPAESTSKTPAADKKAKVTPQKTDGKKANVHVATPHPAKQAKTPANKPNQQTSKSGGTHACNSCNKSFGSDKALESHSKAKHAAN